MFSQQINVVLKTNLNMKIRIMLIESFNISKYVSNYFIFKMIELPVKNRMKFPKCMQMQQKSNVFTHQINVVLKMNLNMKFFKHN